LIDGVEKHLKEFGRRVLEGAIEIAPYRKSKEVACARCEFASVCRFDPWQQPYRSLAAPPKASKPKKGKAESK
jgi:ATP-dependent helicase/nuclease subunit B